VTAAAHAWPSVSGGYQPASRQRARCAARASFEPDGPSGRGDGDMRRIVRPDLAARRAAGTAVDRCNAPARQDRT
jgi:hypothetical protein